MRLVSAQFSGFGRLAEAKINLDHKVIVIVGPNEAGKTTLLEALAYINNGKSLSVSERARALESPVGDDDIVVEIKFILDKDDQASVAELDLDVPPKTLWISRTAGQGIPATRVEPDPMKNTETLAACISDLINAATDEAVRALAPTNGDQDDEVAEPSEHRRSLPSRIEAAITELSKESQDRLEARIEHFGPRVWADEFNEHGIDGPIRVAIDNLLEWVDRPDPSEAAAQMLFSRAPVILMFSNEDRNLASTYTLTDQLIANPHAALGNLCTMAGLSLPDLWRSQQTGNKGERETLIAQANRELEAKFAAAWNQSDICALFDMEGTRLDIMISQGGSTITQFDERSAGLKMFVALVAFLSVKDHQTPPILLVDEAETHLHIDAQADLVTQFITQQQAAKVIYTTHSPACLPPDLGTNIRAVVPDPENSDRSLIDSSFWTKGVGFSPLMLAMGAGAAAFSSVRKAVLAEGASEMILLPTLIKQAIGETDLDYQIAPGLAEVPSSPYSDLDLEGARVAFLVDGDAGGGALRDRLENAGVNKELIVELAVPTLENLLDSDAYKRAIVELLREDPDAPELSVDDFPDLQSQPSEPWATVVERWGKRCGYAVPGKRVVACRLIERGWAKPGASAISSLKNLHAELSAALGARPA